MAEQTIDDMRRRIAEYARLLARKRNPDDRIFYSCQLELAKQDLAEREAVRRGGKDAPTVRKVGT